MAEKFEGKGWKAVSDGKQLVITVDLNNNEGLSGSGKNQIIATSSGNVSVGGEVKMGLNVYKKDTK